MKKSETNRDSKGEAPEDVTVTFGGPPRPNLSAENVNSLFASPPSVLGAPAPAPNGVAPPNALFASPSVLVTPNGLVPPKMLFPPPRDNPPNTLVEVVVAAGVGAPKPPKTDVEAGWVVPPRRGADDKVAVIDEPNPANGFAASVPEIELAARTAGVLLVVGVTDTLKGLVLMPPKAVPNGLDVEDVATAV